MRRLIIVVAVANATYSRLIQNRIQFHNGLITLNVHGYEALRRQLMKSIASSRS